MRVKNLCRPWMPAILLGITAACSDSLGPGIGGELTTADAAQTVAAMATVTDTASDAFTSLALGVPAFSNGAASLIPADGGLLPRSALNRVPGEPALAMFPSNYIGQTFVYNVETNAYEIDETRDGAPADGVRLIYYAIDPIDDRPYEPLIELGFVDLRDLSSPTSDRLGIQIWDTAGDVDLSLVDYFVDVVEVVDGGATTITASAEGFVSNGERQVDFVLEHTLSFSDQSDMIGLSVDDLLTLDVDGATLHLVGDGEVPIGSDEPSTMSISMSVENDRGTALLVAEVAGATLGGSLSLNGEERVVIAGTREEPSFARPDGSAISDGEASALREIWHMVGRVIDFADRMFDPFVRANSA